MEEQKTQVVVLNKNDAEKFIETDDEIIFNFDKTMEWGLLTVYAPWCGYCQEFEPDLDFLSKELKKYNVHFFKINGDDDENRDLVDLLNIRGYPSLYELVKTNVEGQYRIKSWDKERSVKYILTYLSSEN